MDENFAKFLESDSFVDAVRKIIKEVQEEDDREFGRVLAAAGLARTSTTIKEAADRS